jgi:NADH-quinone oxidoreductase subunit G
MQEVAKDDVLGFVNRGGHTTLTVYPGRLLDNNYSLNTVDICPVGALTSKGFRFSMRVWFLRETKSLDVNCGTGTNIPIGSRGKYHLSDHPARKRFREFLLDARQPQTELPLRQQ